MNKKLKENAINIIIKTEVLSNCRYHIMITYAQKILYKLIVKELPLKSVKSDVCQEQKKSL